MQSGDSIRTTMPIGKPLQIESRGGNSMILPEVEIPTPSIDGAMESSKIQLFQRQKNIHPDGIILTPDSTNYLIIAPKHDALDYLNVEFRKQDSVSFDLFRKIETSSLDSLNFASVGQKDSIAQAKPSILKKDGFQGIKPNLKTQQDGIFVLTLICFALIVYAIKTEGETIIQKIKNIFSINVTNKEQTSMPLFAGLCLTIQTVLIFSLLLFHIFSVHFSPYQSTSPILTTLAIACGISLFIGLKMQISRILGVITYDKRLIQSMRLQHLSAFQLLGVFCFLPTLLYIYSEGLGVILLSLIVIFFLFERIITIYHISAVFLQEKINFLFLIVYLCTVEILPYFILYEIVKLIYKLDLTSILWH